MKNITTSLFTFLAFILCWGVTAQTQIGMDIDGEAASDQSGYAISTSADGNTVAIGAPYNGSNNNGHVRVYEFNGTSWSSKGGDIDGEIANEFFGSTVSLSADGNTLAIGAPYNGSSGHVQVYIYNGTSWVRKGGDIDGEATSEYSGWSVSLSNDGNTVAIGAPLNNSRTGLVRAYIFNGTSWIKKGGDIYGEANSEYGHSVNLSADGNTVAIGGPEYNGLSGIARVYGFNGTSWVQKGTDFNATGTLNRLGYSVSLSDDGNTVAIGATFNSDIDTFTGQVRVFVYNGTSWIPKGGDINGETRGDESGYSVSLSADGNTVAIGAPWNDTNSPDTTEGHVRVYGFNGSSWFQKGIDIDGEASNDFSGAAVSLSADGSIVAIGAPFNSASAGHVRVYGLPSCTLSITCPANVTVNTDPGICGALASGVSLGSPSTNNCAGEVITNNAPVTFPVGTTTVTWTVTDGSGSMSCATQTVTVTDNENPTITCPTDITVNNDPGVCVADVIYGIIASDNCPGVTYIQTAGLSSGSDFPVGTTTNTFVVTDAAGNTGTCSFDVIVSDNENPTITCPADITVNNDPGVCGAVVTFTPTVTDNCSGSTVSSSPASGSLFAVGTTLVTVTGTDASGNTSLCTFTVTVNDTEPPTAVCMNATVLLDASGNGSITAAAVDGGSTDNCGIASIAVDIDTFTCYDVGSSDVTLTVTDVNGNTSTCIAEVSVEDFVPPSAVCMDITIQLDPTGSVSILGSDVDGGSTDACGILSTDSNIDTFDCSNVGPNTVILSVQDVNGNTSTCTAIVTVEDNIPPTAVCMNTTIQLDANGMASIVPADIDGGSSDTCGIASLAVDMDTFDCSNVGTNTVTLTVTDVNGNVSTCTAIVTVEDSIAPLMNCPADITVGTDMPLCGATVHFADPLPVDNCGIASVIQTAGLPSGSVFPVGVSVITYTATDVNGNTTPCSFTITVVDDDAPLAMCMDITIQLDAAGITTIVPADVDGGSIDNCGVTTRTIDIDTFTCANVGANNVTLTVSDAAGNSATCLAVVTVEDVTPPVAVCQDITVILDATGIVTIDPSLLDGGSTDACGTANFTYIATPDTFTCVEVGENTVTLTVTDENGNSATCEATVTVVDATAPTLVCQDITVQLDENGLVSIEAADVIASLDDACGIDTTGLDIDDFSCHDIGTPVVVNVFANDVNGNIVSCTATVTVVDELAPVLTCPADQTVAISNGTQYTVPDYFATGEAIAIDNCTDLVTLTSQDPAVGAMLDPGTYTVSITAEDAFGNEASCTFKLTIDELLGVANTGFDMASLTMYPNPATTYVLLSNPQNIPLKDVSIYDVTGRLIKKLDASQVISEMRIDTSELASATYMILITTEAGQVTKQLVKE